MLEVEDDWMKVATADGYVVYIKTKSLKNQKKEKTSRDFTEPVYSDMTEDHSINMAWHNVTNVSANQSIQSMLATTKGLTTIAPTWFSLADTEGNITSIADTDYVQYAKQAGLEVWAVFRDFHGGTNSYDEEDLTNPCAFLIGNEGNGLRREIADMADCYVKIPMLGQVESLHAAIASSVLMFEAARQRRKV